MILLLGTSNTVGGHDKNLEDSSIMIHTMLSKNLNCDILNLAAPGRGTERYSESLIYACKHYKPKFILAEIYIDRTYSNFWFPTKDIEEIVYQDLDTIYNCAFEERVSWNGEQKFDQRYLDSRINRITKNPDHLKKFNRSTIKWHPVEKALDIYKSACVYLDEDHMIGLRSMRNLVNLQNMAELLNIPIAFVSYGGPAVEFNITFVESLTEDNYLNKWCNLPLGVIEWAGEQLNGRHFSYDGEHLNSQAEQLIVDQLFAPFIKHFANNNNIQL